MHCCKSANKGGFVCAINGSIAGPRPCTIPDNKSNAAIKNSTLGGVISSGY